MKNFTKLELLKSLAMPIGTFLFGAVALGGEIKSGEVYFTGYAAVRTLYYPLAVMLIGGVLPAALTFFCNIHTERYFFKRLCAYGVCYVYLWIGGQFSFGILSTIWHIMTAAGNVVWVLLKVQDEETSGGESAVMFISDFYLWFCLDYCLMAFRELANMSFISNM